MDGDSIAARKESNRRMVHHLEMQPIPRVGVPGCDLFVQFDAEAG